MLFIKQDNEYREASVDDIAQTLRQTLLPHTSRIVFADPEIVSNYLIAAYALKPKEVFGIIALDDQLRLIAIEELAWGTQSECYSSPRLVLEAVLRLGCTRLMVFHNHPSGSTVASQADITFTRRLIYALKAIDMRLEDHFIIAGSKVLSMRTDRDGYSWPLIPD
jgi:DNA repair protein RadC